MAISKIVYKSSAQAAGETWMDATPATAAAEDITAHKSAMLSNGIVTTGTGTGGGGSSVEPKDVNFYDYDGTITNSYTAQEFAALDALPANPSHTGLTAQGWNWTLANAKTYVQKYGKLDIGHTYTTQSGDTEIDCVFDDPNFLSPYLAIAVNGTVEVEWGDNSVKDTMTGTSNTTLQYQQHVYATPLACTIKIHVVSGQFTFYGANNYASVLRTVNAANNLTRNKTYSNAIRDIRIGSGAKIGYYAFNNCQWLRTITIPTSITSIGTYSFYNCYSLIFVSMPSSIASVGSYALCYCGSLVNFAFSESTTGIDTYAFQYCRGLKRITIPSNTTSIGQSAFSNCEALTELIVPDEVTSIGASAFEVCRTIDSFTTPKGITTISSNLLNNCMSLRNATIHDDVTEIGSGAFGTDYSLAVLTIPSKVTSIGNSAFSYCYSLSELYMKPTTPPTLGGTSVFTNIPSDCKIYVPYSADHSILAAYQSETNWSAQASKMVEEAAP